MKDLSIIIVNWNTCDLLQQCLSSLFERTHQATYEVFVVDNGSSDGSIDMVSQHFPTVLLIQNQENFGFAKANNQALRLFSGRYALLLNSDTVITDHALTDMVAFMDTHPSAGIAGTRLLNPDGSRQYSCDDFPRKPLIMVRDKLRDTLFPGNQANWEHREERRDFNSNFAIDYVIGAVLLIRRETLNQIGLLDEQFFMYTEDIDWCYRAALTGWQTYYLGTISIYHHNRGSSEKTLTLSSNLEKLRNDSLQKFYQKHYGTLSALIMHTVLFAKQ